MLRSLLCVCVVLAGCASTTTKQSNEPIRVSCEARTFEQAKNICFSNAIEFAVGAVVVSSTEVRSHRLAKDEILKHSSGYVDDFKIEGRIDEPNRVMLIMDVTVKQSKIAERIMGMPNGNKDFEGQRFDAQYSTFMKNKKSGDELLKIVLDDFHKYAIKVEQYHLEYKVDIDRNPVVEIGYTLSWNYKYLQALNEALSLTQDKKDISIRQESIHVQSKDPNAWFLGTTDNYYFNDVYRSTQIKKTLTQPVYVRVDFKDSYGRLVKSGGCGEPEYMVGPYHYPNVPFVVTGNEKRDIGYTYTIKMNREKLANVHEVTLSISDKPCRIID